MHEINNEKFGEFVVQLRKEKGMTQKELAEKLYVSDKAVSKWERGLSLPDIALLQPMAETLGVSVTELLSGQMIRPGQTMTVQEVEPLVATALTMTAQEQAQQRENRRKWGRRFLWSLVLCGAEEALLWRFVPQLFGDFVVFAILTPLIAAIFGVYFIFFAKEKLPAFYDQYKVNFYCDETFHMNFPGVYFNNSNWPHILDAMRAWACWSLAGWVAVYAAVGLALDALKLSEWTQFAILMPLMFVALFGGMFIPIRVVGKKYE